MSKSDFPGAMTIWADNVKAAEASCFMQPSTCVLALTWHKVRLACHEVYFEQLTILITTPRPQERLSRLLWDKCVLFNYVTLVLNYIPFQHCFLIYLTLYRKTSTACPQERLVASCISPFQHVSV